MFKFQLQTLILLLVSLLLTQCKAGRESNNKKLINSSDTPEQIALGNQFVKPIPDLKFPTDAGLFNITDYGAKPNDGIDDTVQIQAAISSALKSKSRYSAMPFIYFPKGTYNLSDQLESRIGKGGWSDGWRAGMILVGESQQGTVLKLSDRLADYSDPKNPRAVIKTGSEQDTKSNPSGSGNRAFRHSIYNMTIDVGRENPGAVGIDYLANNRGGIENIIIRSNGEGFAGILMKRYGPGPALVKNAIVEGFDYGVWISNYEYSMTFEHLRLKNQKVAGIYNKDNVLYLRDLVSINSVPAIEMVTSNGQITLIDSKLINGARGNAAIVNKGKMFIRNVTSQGYGKIIADRTKARKDIRGGSAAVKLQEYVSHAPKSLFDSPQHSLNLPIEETPEFHTNDFNQWKNVVTYGATPDDRSNDDTNAIQSAIDSGKPIVYLPRGVYHVRQTIIVRGNVRKIIGMQSAIGKQKGFIGDVLIRFEGGTSSEGTNLEHLRIGGTIEHASANTLAIRHADIGGYRNTTSGKGKLFIEDVIGAPYLINKPQKVWGRQLNAEFGKVALIENHGGTLWILGMKTEGRVTAIETVNGTTELIGALLYPLRNVPANIPAFINDEGRVTLSYAVSGHPYLTQVKERQGGQWRSLSNKNVPSRGRGSNVPLYIGLEQLNHGDENQ